MDSYKLFLVFKVLVFVSLQRRRNDVCLGREPLFTKRGTVTLHSLKSGVAEFFPEGELSDQHRQQIKVSTFQQEHSL